MPPNLQALMSMSDEADYPCLKTFWQDKYRATTKFHWNRFYKHNTTNFFKNRHWLDLEFPGIMSREGSVGLEVGCGVGNLVFPALERNSTLRMYACDFSDQALSLVKSNKDYAGLAGDDRLVVFAADITSEEPFPGILPASLDFITCIFVLSAIPPEQHTKVLQKFVKLLKPGGCICFRDYAVGDLAQQRFQRAKEVPKLENYLYVRHDGTMSYFFSHEYMQAVVASLRSLEVESLSIIERRLTNVKRELDIARYFLQGVFKKSTVK